MVIVLTRWTTARGRPTQHALSRLLASQRRSEASAHRAGTIDPSIAQENGRINIASACAPSSAYRKGDDWTTQIWMNGSDQEGLDAYWEAAYTNVQAIYELGILSGK